MILRVPFAIASEKYNFDYHENAQLTDDDFIAFDMTITGTTNDVIGCAVFRKTIAAGDGTWISLQLLKNHILMVITPNTDRISTTGVVTLILGSRKISRLKKDGHLTTYYLLSDDVDQIMMGKSVLIPGDKPVNLLKAKEFNRLGRYLSCF